MNWYKIYKFAFERTLSQKLTKSLSRQIFNIIKDNLGHNVDKTLEVVASDKNRCDLFIYVMYDETYTGLNKNFFIKAFNTFPKDKAKQAVMPLFIRFEIRISGRFSALDFPRLNYDLYEAVRHELKHYWQYLDPNYVAVENETDYINDILVDSRKLRDKLFIDTSGKTNVL